MHERERGVFGGERYMRGRRVFGRERERKRDMSEGEIFCFFGEGDMSLLHLSWKHPQERRKKSRRKVFLSPVILRCNKDGHVSTSE
jgi:hypothetical protein